MRAAVVAALAVVGLLAKNIAVAQQPVDTQKIVTAVSYCVKFVHSTPPQDQYLESFYKHFDAFYNPLSGNVENNAISNGDQQAYFVFRKCLSTLGVYLK